MKLIFFSDIHGNSDSLISIYNLPQENGQALFLGDAISRGYNPKEDRVVSALRSRPNLQCIKGNHDKEGFCDLEKISEENIRFLQSLPEHLAIDNILAFHSSFRGDDVYLFGEEDVEEEYKHIRENVGEFKYHLFGHIHQKAVYSCNPEDNTVSKLEIKPAMFLPPGLDYFISPGALCLHAIGGMSYATLDTRKRRLRYHKLKSH